MTTIPKVITLKWLKDHSACDEAIEVFKKAFGRSTPLTTVAIERFVRAAGRASGHLWRAWLFEAIGLPHALYCDLRGCGVGGSARKALNVIRKANG